MTPRTLADDSEGDEPWAEEDAEELPDEVDARADEGDVDLPATHMSEEEYAQYAAREFDAEGRERGEPPVAAIVIGLTLLIVVVALLLA